MKKFLKIVLISILLVAIAGVVYFFIKGREAGNSACSHETLSVIDSVPVTCEQNGYTSGVKCEDCGEILIERQALPSLNHDLVTHAAQYPTCTADGHNEYVTCSRCDYSTFELLPALGHDIVAIAGIPATCSRTGLTQGAKCGTCGEVFVERDIIPSLNHDLVTHAAQAPTCKADGHNEYVACSQCDYTTFELLPALGHSEYSYSYETTDGYIVSYKKCNYCGIAMSESEITEKPEIEDEDELYIYDVEEISDFAYYGEDYRYVYISSDVQYVGSCAFANCPEYLVIEVSIECDTSTWAEDWYMGNGDGETPYMVIFV